MFGDVPKKQAGGVLALNVPRNDCKRSLPKNCSAYRLTLSATKPSVTSVIQPANTHPCYGRPHVE
jgi:hypothetical protein